jgi:hypothetical protein
MEGGWKAEDCTATSTAVHAQVTSEGIGNVEGQALEGPLLGRSRVIGRAETEAAVSGLLPGMIGLM